MDYSQYITIAKHVFLARLAQSPSCQCFNVGSQYPYK